MNGETSRRRRLLGWAPLVLLAIAAASGWAAFLGGGMRSIFGWLGLILPIPLLAFVVLVGTVIRTILRRRHFARLVATLVLAGFCFWPAGWQVGVAAITYPYALAKTRPSATVRLPTDAPMRVIWGGDDVAHNRHAALPDQRWAYDLTVEPALGGSSRLEDYGCWGVPVVAPLAGKIHVAHDGEVDRVPGKRSKEYRAPLGNHVVIGLSETSQDAAYLIVAHLKKDSIVVHEGDVVAEGAPIGACGNSGNTSEPHVHIHVQRQDPRGRPVNFSEGLPLFFRDHDGAPMPLGGVDVVGERAVARGVVVRHVGTRPSGALAR
jgi:Peptidase family M23